MHSSSDPLIAGYLDKHPSALPDWLSNFLDRFPSPLLLAWIAILGSIGVAVYLVVDIIRRRQDKS